MRPLSGWAGLFLDRDGIINERRSGGYVTTWDEFVFRPTVMETLRSASQRHPIIVVSNQRCIARGIATVDDVERLMNKMCDELIAHGVDLAGWYVCPHDHSDGCNCRKPRPGMLLAAAARLAVDLTSSFMIGDSPSDVAAGEAAGCRKSFLCDPANPQVLFNAVNTILGDCVNVK